MMRFEIIVSGVILVFRNKTKPGWFETQVTGQHVNDSYIADENKLSL